MIPAPHVNEKSGEVVSQKSWRYFHNAISEYHGGRTERHHPPEFVGGVVVESFQGGHIRPYKVCRHEVSEIKRSKVEKGSERSPYLQTSKCGLPVKKEVGWVFVVVGEISESGGGEGAGEVEFGEGG